MNHPACHIEEFVCHNGKRDGIFVAHIPRSFPSLMSERGMGAGSARAVRSANVAELREARQTLNRPAPQKVKQSACFALRASRAHYAQAHHLINLKENKE